MNRSLAFDEAALSCELTLSQRRAKRLVELTTCPAWRLSSFYFSCVIVQFFFFIKASSCPGICEAESAALVTRTPGFTVTRAKVPRRVVSDFTANPQSRLVSFDSLSLPSEFSHFLFSRHFGLSCVSFH